MKHHLSLRKLSLFTGIVCVLFMTLSATAPGVSAHDGLDLEHPTFINDREAVNVHTNRLVVKAHIQINRPGEQTATLIDKARAFSSCTDCNTFAVALQINLISPNATNDDVEMVADARNYKCTRCTTAAIAVQMDVFTYDYHVPDSVRDLVRQLNEQLNYVSRHPHMSLGEAEQRIGDVIDQFLSIHFPSAPGGAAATRAATRASLPHVRMKQVRTTAYNS